MPAGRSLDSLTSRYYGLMIGFFVHLARLELPPSVYESHRVRIDEVLRELGIELTLPATHDSFVAGFDALTKEVVARLKQCDGELADFFAFGFFALRLLADVDDGDNVDRVIRADFDGVVARYSLDREALQKILHSPWDSEHRDEALWTELASRFYELATIAIWPLRKQPGLCFVIMPFGEPFAGYYLDFYRPALQRAGYRCMRAWVGLTNELYLRLLATLISRCDAALADLSAQPGSRHPNLNVIHEVGLNMGLENLTFLVRNQEEVLLPSNFTGLAILEYDATDPEFPEAVAAELAEHLQPPELPGP